VQNTVHPEANFDLLANIFNVNVGSKPLDGRAQKNGDYLDDRRLFNDFSFFSAAGDGRAGLTIDARSRASG